MARKMTPQQLLSLARINAGWPEASLQAGYVTDAIGHIILSSHNCMDGREVRCHRTIKTTTPAGSQTQSFRIAPDGSIERKL